MASFDFTGAVLPAGATLARATTGTRVNNVGNIVTAAINEARFDYDGSTTPKTLKGLIYESDASNMLTQSEAMDNVAWTMAATTVVANATTAPTNAVVADRVVETAINAQHRVQQSVATVVGQTYTLSCYIKAAERSWFWLRAFGAAIYAGAYFNLNTLAVTSVTGTAGIVPHANGWYRVWVSGLCDSPTSIAYLTIVDDTGVGSYLGDTSKGIYVWGAQLETFSRSSYIPTTGAAVPRSADVMTLDWSSKSIADSTIIQRFTFDDGSTQDVPAAVVNGLAAVPTSLNKSRIQMIEARVYPSTPAGRSIILDNAA